MKKLPVLIALNIFLFGSCANNNEKKSDTNETLTEGTAHACYEYSKDSSMVKMHLITTGNKVSGDLMFDYFEKDKNNGTILGEMKGDTLFADYTFMSEGATSVREVVFLKKGMELNEGYGEVEEQNGKFVFKNKGALTFNSKIVLQNISCK